MRNYLLVVIVLLCSCSQDKVVSYSHTYYFDSVLHQAEIVSSVHPEHTESFLDSAYNAFPEPGIIDVYRKYLFLANTTNDVNLGTAYVDSMIWAIREHLNEPEIAEYYGNALLKKGDQILVQRDFDRAFSYIYIGRKVIGANQDPCLLSAYTLALARISYLQEKYLDAARFLRQGLTEVNGCMPAYNSFKKTQGILDDLGIMYIRAKMPDSAVYFFDSALQYLRSHQNDFPEIANSQKFVEIASGVIYGNWGDGYMQKGDTAMAEELYRRGIAINGRSGYDHGDAQCTMLKLAGLYVTTGRLKEAGILLNRIEGSLDSFENLEWRQRWLRLKMDYLRQSGRAAEVYDFFTPYLHLRDSLARTQRMPSQDVSEEYERRYKLAELQKDNETQNVYLMVALVISVLTFSVALLQWNNWKRSKKFNQRISRQNSEMQLAMNALSESQTDNTRMMQVVAHDLKNPIASMTSVASILLDNRKLDEDERRMLELMQETSVHALELIDDLLVINTSSGVMKKEPVEMSTLLHYCVDLMQFRADEKEQKIILESEEVSLMINREKMWRVVSNLLVNAIKFSPKGNSIYIVARRQGAYFVIEVRDQGMGIPENMRLLVFDMFTTAKRAGTAGEPSTGLGLAISRRIVEAHGGTISLESTVGKGTTFYVSLPL